MTKQRLKIAALMVVFVTAMLYLVEWVSDHGKPVVSGPLIKLPVLSSTNAISYEVREHLNIALDHVRGTLAHSTNSADIEALRLVEISLTNALAHP